THPSPRTRRHCVATSTRLTPSPSSSPPSRISQVRACRSRAPCISTDIKNINRKTSPEYEQEAGHNPILLELTKMEFNLLQAVHLKELKAISEYAWIFSGGIVILRDTWG
uniref:Uncharacterized protein n=1 Tax=Aegilops tauschii subsp. strangulata TaxID=200361 RepID=A0A453A6H6_AEGTS